MSIETIQKIELISDGITGSETVWVSSLTGNEELSSVFEFTVTLVIGARDAINVQKTLNAPATINFFSNAGKMVRSIYGMIIEVNTAFGAGDTKDFASDAYKGNYACTVKVVPRAWALTLSEKTEVFVGLSVPEIIEAKLKGVFSSGADAAGGADYDVSNIINNSNYAKRELVVQYNESDYNFIRRLAEHLGIAFYFDHSKGKDVIVFSDSNAEFLKITDPDAINFKGPSDVEVGLLTLSNFIRSIPNEFKTRDYDPGKPDVTLNRLATETSTAQPSGEVYEYGPNVDVGTVTGTVVGNTATIRKEEAVATRCVFSGDSDVFNASPGFTIGLSDSTIIASSKLSTSSVLVFVRVRHRYAGSPERGGAISGEYANDFDAIPSDITYRPARRTPTPKVAGVIQAKIEGTDQSDNKNPYAQLDDQGRYLVRWFADWTDPTPAFGKASNRITMAQPHGGPRYGIHFPLRPGVIVLLACIEGDPDRPVILGVAPDVGVPGPISSENAYRNIILTGGLNELNFDDTNQAERATLSSPYQNTALQLGAPEKDANRVHYQEQGALLRSDGSISLGADKSISDIAQQVLGFAGTFLSSLSTQAFHVVSKKVSDTVTDLLNRASGKEEDKLVSDAAQSAASQMNQDVTNTTKSLWSNAQSVVDAAQIGGMSSVGFGSPEQLLVVLAEEVAAFVASNGSAGNAFVTAQQVLALYGKSKAQMTSDSSVDISSKNTLNGYAANAMTYKSDGTLNVTSAKAATYVSDDKTSFTSTADYTETSTSGNIAMTAASAGIKGNATTITWTGTQSVTASSPVAKLALDTSSGTLSTGPASVQTAASGLTMQGGPQAQLSASTISINGDGSVAIKGAAVTVNGAFTVNGSMISLG